MGAIQHMAVDSFDIGPESILKFHAAVENVSGGRVLSVRINQVKRVIVVYVKAGEAGVIELGKRLPSREPKTVLANRKKNLADIGYGPVPLNPNGYDPAF
jgi:hypothetical protein